ncbi:Tricalbin-2 [Glugoides intestinalis]
MKTQRKKSTPMPSRTNTQKNMPMTPNNVPVTRNPIEPERPSENARKINDPLGFKPLSGLAKAVKIPGLLLFCIILGYLIGRFKLSFIFLLPVGHIAYYFFYRRVKEYKRSIEALEMEKVRNELVHGFETVEWINHIVEKFWEVSEQTISSIIFNEVNNVLKKVSEKQPFKLRLSEITLGTRPPVIERILFVQNAESRIVLECATNFIPVQASEETLAYFKKERSHWNTYIEIQVILANLITIPILVKDFTFSGIFRIELDLMQKLPFTKMLRFTFLEIPVVDFKLIPLKSVDMLDLPYIGGLLNSVIEMQIKKMALLPKFINVNLEEISKLSGKVIGVVYVFLHDLEAAEQSTFWVSLDNKGRIFGKTEKKSGKDSLFNQGFYDIISDTSLHLQVGLQSTEHEPRNGRITLRNLNKHVFSEKLHLSNEISQSFLNVTTHFYPICDTPTDNAIINLTLISIEDLQCSDSPVNMLYSTFCIISLEKNEAIVSRKVIKKFESKRIFTTKDPFYNERFQFFVRGIEDHIIKIEVMNEKNNKKLGHVILPCNDIKNKENLKYRVSGVESGEMNVKLEVKYINMEDKEFTEEELYAQKYEKQTLIGEEEKEEKDRRIVVEKKTDEVLGAYIECKDIPNMRRKEQKEQHEPFIGIHNQVIPEQSFVEYKKAYKLAVKSITATGSFYMVFETDYVNVAMEPFSTDIEVCREVVIPIRNEREIHVRLFKMTIAGDILVSEEVLGVGSSVVVFDKIRVEFTVEAGEFGDFNEIKDGDEVKVLQVRIGEFNKAGAFTGDYMYEGLVQNNKLIHRLNTFILGSENLFCKLSESSKEIAHVMIPKRNCKEEFVFGGTLKANVYCKAQVCKFTKKRQQRYGELEVFIIKTASLSKSKIDTYIKVLLNNEKIYKTEKKLKCTDAVYNESFRINVERNIDKLSFHVYSMNALSTDTLIHFKEIPLFNIPNGYSRYTVQLRDKEAESLGIATLQLIFNYKGISKGMKFDMPVF